MKERPIKQTPEDDLPAHLYEALYNEGMLESQEDTQPATRYYELWQHLYERHDLILTESELQDIIALVERIEE